MAPELIIGGVLGLLGAALLLGAAVTTVRARRLVVAAERVQGRVVRLRDLRDGGRGRAMKAPVVEFPYQGATRVLEGSVGANPPRYEVGAMVTVLVPQAEPDGALIESFGELYFLPALMAGFGILCAGIGLVIGRLAA